MNAFYLLNNITPYGVMIVVGILFSGAYGYFMIRKYNIDDTYYWILWAYSIGFGFLGAKLLYLLVDGNIDWSRISEREYAFNVIRGGFVFYGGVLGGILGFAFAWLIHRCDVKAYISVCIGCLPITHAFGRIGCYLAGCCYGIPYDGPFAVVYESDMGIGTPEGIGLFPVQLLEAVLNLFIAIIITILIFHFGRSLVSVAAYGLMYGIVRFILEYLRYDSERGSFLFFSTSQWISIVAVAASAIMLFVCLAKGRKGIVN